MKRWKEQQQYNSRRQNKWRRSRRASLRPRIEPVNDYNNITACGGGFSPERVLTTAVTPPQQLLRRHTQPVSHGRGRCGSLSLRQCRDAQTDPPSRDSEHETARRLASCSFILLPQVRRRLLCGWLDHQVGDDGDDKEKEQPQRKILVDWLWQWCSSMTSDRIHTAYYTTEHVRQSMMLDTWRGMGKKDRRLTILSILSLLKVCTFFVSYYYSIVVHIMIYIYIMYVVVCTVHCVLEYRYKRRNNKEMDRLFFALCRKQR